jgi:hypothetical protein
MNRITGYGCRVTTAVVTLMMLQDDLPDGRPFGSMIEQGGGSGGMRLQQGDMRR